MKKKQTKKKAAAIGFNKKHSNAPKLMAKGEGLVAEKILAVAKQHGIPVQEDADLLELLAALDIDEEIPPRLYSAVAEVLAFIYRMNGKLPA